MVHNRYLERGGEDESVDLERRLLERHGHEVELYEEDNRRVAEIGRLRTAARTVWSIEGHREVTRRLGRRPFDLVHVQNSFPLISPSAHHAARSLGVPVVQTLRNYRLWCANGLFFRDGRPCEDCFGRAPWPGVLHGCYRGSRAGSAVVAAMQSTHRVLGTWRRTVGHFVVLSRFAAGKLTASGIPPERVMIKPNFLEPDPGPSTATREGFLFVGRLSPEKGVETLLRAWEAPDPPGRLTLVGGGPLEERVRAAAATDPRISWLGRLPREEVVERMGHARALIFPSEWYETFGRVAIEAYARGTPVVASRIGAVAELVEHERTGLLFTPGVAADLLAQLHRLRSDPELGNRLGRAAREEFERRYTAEVNYRSLLEIYRSVTARTVGAPPSEASPAG